MSKRVVTTGYFEDGQFFIRNRARFLDACLKMGKEVRITAEKRSRSLAQNDLLWAWNTIVANELGWTPEDVHEYSKSELLQVHRTRINKNTGEVMEAHFAGTTHDLSMNAMAEYMNRYLQYWAEEGIVLPATEDEWLKMEAQ